MARQIRDLKKSLCLGALQNPQGNFVRSWGSSLYGVLYIFETLWRHGMDFALLSLSILSHQPAHQKMTVKSLGTHPYERGQGLTCQQTHLGPNHFQLSNERSLEMAQFQSPFQPHRCEICKTSGATAFIFFVVVGDPKLQRFLTDADVPEPLHHGTRTEPQLQARGPQQEKSPNRARGGGCVGSGWLLMELCL